MSRGLGDVYKRQEYLHIDTFNIFYARIIVEQKKTFYFCTKIMDRDSDEAYRFQIKVL